MLSKITIALVSTISILPTQAIAYTYINPRVFVKQSPEILRNLGASDSLLKINRVASEKMTEILESQMVQGMAKGTLSKEEWDRKYMRADALYIYNLGRALAIRAANENEQDSVHVRDFAEMFLGYGKHFERLKKYGLSNAAK